VYHTIPVAVRATCWRPAAGARVDRSQKASSMSSDDDQDVGVYRVVLNHEEQYSIWPEWSRKEDRS